MNTIDTQIPEDATLVFALITAFTIGLLGNKGVNSMMSSPNVKQKAELEQKLEEEVIVNYETQKMIAGLKLDSIEEKATGEVNEEVTPTK